MLKAAFEKVAEHNKDDWQLGPESEAWSLKMARRARAMRRDVDQALLKLKSSRDGPKPQWLAKFTEVELKDDEEAGSSSATAPPAVQDSGKYQCKLNRAEKVVYRVQIGMSKPGARDASKPLEVDPAKDQDDSVVAHWADGMQWEVPNLTHGMLLAMNAGGSDGNGRPVHYHTELKTGEIWRLYEYQDGRDGSSLRLKGKGAPPMQLIITRHSAEEKAKACGAQPPAATATSPSKTTIIIIRIMVMGAGGAVNASGGAPHRR